MQDMGDKLKVLLDGVTAYMNTNFRSWLQEADRLSSPIEQLLYMAFFSVMLRDLELSKSVLVYDVKQRTLQQALNLSKRAKYRSILVFPQVTIDRYVADFIVASIVGDKMIIFAVECDGHDYHERTKEQAEHDRRRDRHFTGAEITVLRYTGREIWRDPYDCARETIDLITAKIIAAEEPSK